MTSDGTIYDAIGVGFGPSNLALAIALDEAGRQPKRQLRTRFIERQQGFTWHGGMLLPRSDMQISFLKDLVSLRDPTSRFTFLRYLHVKGRLEAFINRKTFYPSRIEFNDYLCWVADHFAGGVAYGEEVVTIEPDEARGTVNMLLVRSRDRFGHERVRLTRNLVMAAGGIPRIPGEFRQISGDPLIFHSSAYLDRIAALSPADERTTRVAVIGRGQSAAEIALDLHNRFSHLGIDLLIRGFALRPSDATPFVNEIFDPAATDLIYQQPDKIRESIFAELRNTNYAVVDGDLIHTLYGILYQQKVEGSERFRMLPMRKIEAAAIRGDAVGLTIRDQAAGTVVDQRYDAVVLATGYERNNGTQLLNALSPFIAETALDRNYRLKTRPEFRPSIHMQGYSEATHGLSDTLLSVLPIRAEEIANSLLAAADAQQSAA
jgi:L-ornithine N5-monooxygenase